MDAFSKVIPKKIKLSDYTTERTLGTGSFGRVKLGKNKSTGKFVRHLYFQRSRIPYLIQSTSSAMITKEKAVLLG